MKTFFFTKRSRDQRGAGKLKGILILVAIVLLVPLLIVGFYEGRKAYWDGQVREMCAKDGGTRVFERELLTRKEAQENGLLVGNELVVPSRPEHPLTSRFYIAYESVYLRTGTPSLFRARTTAVRSRDEKVLAEMITYSRVGGDFPTFAHPSAMTCQDADTALIQFRTAIQIKKEGQ